MQTHLCVVYMHGQGIHLQCIQVCAKVWTWYQISPWTGLYFVYWDKVSCYTWSSPTPGSLAPWLVPAISASHYWVSSGYHPCLINLHCSEDPKSNPHAWMANVLLAKPSSDHTVMLRGGKFTDIQEWTRPVTWPILSGMFQSHSQGSVLWVCLASWE